MDQKKIKKEPQTCWVSATWCFVVFLTLSLRGHVAVLSGHPLLQGRCQLWGEDNGKITSAGWGWDWLCMIGQPSQGPIVYPCLSHSHFKTSEVWLAFSQTATMNSSEGKNGKATCFWKSGSRKDEKMWEFSTSPFYYVRILSRVWSRWKDWY